MPDAHAPRRWYRSLYGRIALGFVLTVASVIAVQALVVLWLVDRAGTATGPPPPGFARLVAQDIGQALAAAPELDVETFVRDEYQQRLYPFVVVLRSGRVAASSGATATPELLGRARALLSRRLDGEPWDPASNERPPPRGPGVRGRPPPAP
jgi:hypothetical protein